MTPVATRIRFGEVAAPDATLLDTSDLDIDQAVAAARALVAEIWDTRT